METNGTETEQTTTTCSIDDLHNPNGNIDAGGGDGANPNSNDYADMDEAKLNDENHIELNTNENEDNLDDNGHKNANHNANTNDQVDLDLYADVESSELNKNNQLEANNDEIDDVNEHDDGVLVSSVDESGLYDDVMAAPTPNMSGEFIPPSDLLNSNGSSSQAGNSSDEAKTASSASNSLNSNLNPAYIKRVSCYVGNLTWWTTDKDLSDAITNLGVSDLLEIKFYENKVNGQSKGFSLVTVRSDQSFRTIMEKLPKVEVNSQNPIVTPFSRHYFNQFEEQARKDMASSAGNGNSNGSNNGGPLMDHHHQSNQQQSMPHQAQLHGQHQPNQQIMSMFKIYYFFLEFFLLI